MKLSEKIIKLRKKQGLSQEEFGEKINTSRQAVSKWELEQSVPDVETIKQIAKVFNVNYDYLLNDEIEEMQEDMTYRVANENSNPKKKHIILKIILAILIVYLLICLYKFIVLFRFYKIADSFSEENYHIGQFYSIDEHEPLEFSITKVGSRRVEESRSPLDSIEEPYGIYYLDTDKKVRYDLVYNEEKGLYEYVDYIEGAKVINETDEVLKMPDDVREMTLSIIPSSFKQILISSLLPNYHVSAKNREINMNVRGMKIRITLSNDYLIQSYDRITEFDGTLKVNFSYDYVQDHFTDIEDPLETYKDRIENYDQIKK